MKKLIIIFLLVQVNAYALIPIEGMIFGDVRDIKQYDPFYGMLNTKYSDPSEDSNQNDQLLRYIALNMAGETLKYSCDGDINYNYSNSWKKDTAVRSIVSTLQYIGLDVSVKAIAEYAKAFEMSEKDYTQLYTNLITNTCSQNVSVFSLKTIKDNFKYYYNNKSGYSLPNIETSPFYSNRIKKIHESADVKKREFEYALKNFRSLCSWNSDVENFGMLNEYVKNPFLMSYVNTSLLNREMKLDKKTFRLTSSKNNKTIRVVCENMICRNRSAEEFENLFPRMSGSSRLEDDLSALYCNEFHNVRAKKNQITKQVREWKEKQTRFEPNIEVMNLISLITGVPEMTLMKRSFSSVTSLFNENIKERWNNWAIQRSRVFNTEQLYEETLNVRLISKAQTHEVEQGNLSVNFNLELGEIDKTLDEVDKLKSTFFLEFPLSYIKYLKSRIPFYYNRTQVEKVKQIESKFVEAIEIQLEKKKKYFKIPLWNKQFSKIIARELLKQIEFSRGFHISKINNKFLKIPVHFNYGIFALSYIREKHVLERKKKKLIFTKN